MYNFLKSTHLAVYIPEVAFYMCNRPNSNAYNTKFHFKYMFYA